ncbi:MAG: exonuclease SbcCD subunit D [Anaerolineaceae bacterium]|nr:exonuclease SbcCD subunit D [Anaerolineaceae bacterium]
MVKLLHFADAHIDMANYGRHDPVSGLPMRVMDFLKSLDEIVQTALDERVDLVIFAGDAYKDRSPAPTFQREWDQRIMRLSQAGIMTILLTGNHDISPSTGRAHAIHEFESLDVPHVKVASKPTLLLPKDLDGLPVQVLCIPWQSQTDYYDFENSDNNTANAINDYIQRNLNQKIENISSVIDPELPLILAAHVSIEGVEYGSERLANISKDFVLDRKFVTNPIFDYTALGHIHKSQDLNEGHQPPAIYPGSIERVDFGEEKEKKFFIVAEVEKGHTNVHKKELKHIRPFITRRVTLDDPDQVNAQIMTAMPSPEKLKDAIVRIILEYPEEFEPLINDSEIRALGESAFEFQVNKRPQRQSRARLPEGDYATEKSMTELLEIYLRATDKEISNEKIESLQNLAQEITQPKED